MVDKIIVWDFNWVSFLKIAENFVKENIIKGIWKMGILKELSKPK